MIIRFWLSKVVGGRSFNRHFLLQRQKSMVLAVVFGGQWGGFVKGVPLASGV